MARGKFDRFEKEVQGMSDEELEDGLQQYDEAFTKFPDRAGLSPLLQRQYIILVEERKRRENAGTTKEEG